MRHLITFCWMTIIQFGCLANPLVLSKDSVRRMVSSCNYIKKNGDSTTRCLFYSSAGLGIPVGSFYKRSIKENYLGKGFTASCFNAGVDLMITNHFGIGFDYYWQTISILNQKLTNYLMDNAAILNIQGNNEVTYPGSFDMRINAYGFNFSSRLQTKKFIVCAKITPLIGSLRYDYLIITTSNGNPVNYYSPRNYGFKPSNFYALKPGITVYYHLSNFKKTGFYFKCAFEYLRFHPTLLLFDPYFEKPILKIEDKISCFTIRIGIALILRKEKGN